MKNFIGLMFACGLSMSSFATTITITDVKINWVGTIVRPALGHAAGNFEIELTAPFNKPADMTCTDTTYITTRGDVANYNSIFAVLLAAKLSGKSLMLGVTDDPQFLAFGDSRYSRCSLVSAAITN